MAIDMDRLARIKATEPTPHSNGASSPGELPADEPTEDTEDTDEKTEGQPKKALATWLVELARERAELWRSPDGELYATVKRDDHREHMRLASKAWKQWLAHICITNLERAASGNAIRDATGALEGIARYEGDEYPVHIRVAGIDDRVYIDLCDTRWRAVEIDRKGWRIVERPPVRFERRPGMLPLPEPTSEGSISALRRHVRIPDEVWPLVAGWLVGALSPRGPYPVLVERAQHGAGKSWAARILRSCIDPNTAPIRSEPREPRDLVISARASHVSAFDNLSSVPPWLSDGLCRLATGGGYAARALYTDGDEFIIDVQRPTILTGITDVVTAPDLIDRALLVDLEAMPPKDRKTERALDMRWREDWPGILGALYTAVSTALERRDEIKIEQLPRLADWATWATAAEPALGLKDGDVIAALAAQAGEATGMAIDASIVARPILEMMADRTDPKDWSGTSTELLTALTARVTESTSRNKAWPQTGRGMSAALARIAPALRERRVLVERMPREASERGWKLTWITAPTNDGRMTVGGGQ